MDMSEFLGVGRFDFTGQSTTRCKFARDARPDRPAGLHDIMQDAIDRIFIKNAEIPIGVEIHF